MTYAVGLSPRKTIRGGDINFNDHEENLVFLHFYSTFLCSSIYKADVDESIVQATELASSPGPKRGPGTHCLCMHTPTYPTIYYQEVLWW